MAIEQIKEKSNTMITEEGKQSKKLVKLLQMMKLRPERVIHIENPLSLKKSLLRKSIDDQQQQLRPYASVKMGSIDPDVFTYPLMI